MTTFVRRIDYEHMFVIEVHYNKILKKDPYLVRVSTYTRSEEFPEELRLNKDEYKHLFRTLKEHHLI